MLLIIALITLTFLQNNMTCGQALFDKYFTGKTMRIDYFHTGDFKTELITIDKIYQYDVYPGNRRNLIDNFNNGKYYIKIHDHPSGQLIFSKGFDSYFGEYQTSRDAGKGIKKTYHETAIIPYPKNMILLSIEKRDDKNLLAEIFKSEIDPGSISVIKDKVKDGTVKVYQPLKNGNPEDKVDVAVIGEG
ncbi:MAG TPA: peptidase M64 N-terminal domain-containing protein, partial [Ignavibacteriaceae bacterium]|nr:peptidase M64 N-terminal domain-containing protein [Ignavibacteriaceae bacterium]